ncbi:MAG: hypothetical protein J4F36_09460 [Nitrosopumilaceae archaeon]|nr:hypothetical protein [Nitrosopumilaceae archaeon]
MQNLDFVKFLSDTVDLKDYQEKYAEFGKSIPDTKRNDIQDRVTNAQLLMSKIAPFAHTDEHSRPKNSFIPSSFQSVNVVIDNLIANEQLLDPITNSIIDGVYRHSISKSRNTSFSEHLISKRIPNFLNEHGPDTDMINSIRDKPNLKEFRKKIDEIIISDNKKSLEELVMLTEDELEYLKLDLLDKGVFKDRVYNTKYSLPKVAGMDLFGILANASTIPYTLTSHLLDTHIDREYYGWVSFITQIELDQKRKTRK